MFNAWFLVCAAVLGSSRNFRRWDPVRKSWFLRGILSLTTSCLSIYFLSVKQLKTDKFCLQPHIHKAEQTQAKPLGKWELKSVFPQVTCSVRHIGHSHGVIQNLTFSVTVFEGQTFAG